MAAFLKVLLMSREETSSSQCGGVTLREPPKTVSLRVSFLPPCHYFIFSEHFFDHINDYSEAEFLLAAQITLSR